MIFVFLSVNLVLYFSVPFYFFTAQLNEMIQQHFGDDPIGELLREIDPTGDALRCMYGEPIKRMSY